jgi:hypothetical protein
MSALRQIGEGLWIHQVPLRFMGVPAGRTMNVVELGDGGLFVHSPAPLEDRLRGELDRLGQVRFVAAPNRLHGHFWMEQYRDAYPGVELLAGPGLQRRRKDLAFAAELGDAPDSRWAGVLDQAPFRGSVMLPEIEFLHRPSRTLIAGDLVMNFGAHSPPTLRLLARAGLMYERLRPTPLFRLSVVRRRRAAEDMRRILSWDFDRVIPGHGAIVESGGHAALGREWARLLR